MEESATQLLEQDKAREELKLLDAEIALGETAELWNDWATIQYSCDYVAQAEWGYRRALDLSPSHRPAAINLLAVLLAQGRAEEAIPLLRQQAARGLTTEEKKVLRSLTEQAGRNATGTGLQNAPLLVPSGKDATVPDKRQISPVYTRDSLAQFGFNIGEFTYGVPLVRWWGEPAVLRIGNYVSIADEVQIFLGGNHRHDWVTTYPFPAIAEWPEAANLTGHPSTNGDISIGNDVWIATKVLIMSGVTIGDGAVIGAGAVVSRDVPAYGIVAGNPARLIRKRFPEEIIARLLALRWWDWPVAKVKRYLPMLTSPDIERFLGLAEAVQDNEALQNVQ